MICSLGGPLPHGSPVVVFLDRGHPRFWNFYSIIPVDFFRVKSYVNCLFDPARVVIRVTISKLYFVPEWLVSGVVGMLTGDPRFMVNLTLRHCTPSHGLDQTGCSAGIAPPSRPFAFNIKKLPKQ